MLGLSVLLPHAGRKVEHRLFYPSDVYRPVHGPRREKGDKAFIDEVLLAVYPELYLPVEAIRVFRVGAHPGDGLIEFMAVRPDGAGLVPFRFFRPVTGEEPRRLHVESPLDNIAVEGNQPPRLFIPELWRPGRAAYHVFKLRNEIFLVPLSHFSYSFAFFF